MNERVIKSILLGVLLLIGLIYAFFFAKKRIEQKNMNEKFKPSVSELLYTFFFGYAAFKWRRLIRTLILIPSVGGPRKVKH